MAPRKTFKAEKLKIGMKFVSDGYQYEVLKVTQYGDKVAVYATETTKRGWNVNTTCILDKTDKVALVK